ncbi:hypothetical protein AVEN_209024-1 [Araneus ventricosus]|uniref:Uncharacterized protein n=1 Tax=Araneus ventricosus TaxID=182803 RepID=A0A4Y2J561_ARAVE|nr:hypothetical protein AVEN_209024-1 [Araneus ventricosus]
MIENALEGVTKRTLTFASKKLWSVSVVELTLRSLSQCPVEPMVNEIMSGQDQWTGDVEDVQHEVLLCMRQQPKEFYAAIIGALIKRWDKCINIGKDYVEK